MPVFIVSGTRPEVIKLFPVYRQLKAVGIDVFWVAAGQHRELHLQALDFFKINVDYFLPVISANNLPEQLSKLVQQLSELFISHSPKVVVVQGDTATTLAASMAAFFLKIKIAYVEAGLRSFDLLAPFPEEANRQIVSRLATLFFAPTERDRNNLLAEGLAEDKIFVTGNTIVDALQYVCENLDAGLIRASDLVTNIVANALKKDQQLILLTMHRRESLDGLADAILAQIYSQVFERPTIFPICKEKHWKPMLVYLRHLNPKYSFVADFFEQDKFKNLVTVLPPLDYKDTIYLLRHSFLVMTDSGGILEEAVSLGKPVVCLREKTERFFSALQEDVFLLGNKAENFSTALKMAINKAFSAKLFKTNTFGDGQAAIKIVNFLKSLVEAN